LSGVKIRIARAGREEEIASPAEGVVLVGEMRPEGANPRVERRESWVASTASDSCS
jgi:hypothetical protein